MLKNFALFSSLSFAMLFMVGCTDYATMFEEDYGYLDSADFSGGNNTPHINAVCEEHDEQSVVVDNVRYYYRCLNDSWVMYDMESLNSATPSTPSTDASSSNITLPSSTGTECVAGSKKNESDALYIYNYTCSGGYWLLTSYEKKQTTNTTKSSSSVKSSSSMKVSDDMDVYRAESNVCGDLWCGHYYYYNDTYRVDTGFDDGSDTYGYWYSYNDNSENPSGNSVLLWPVSLGNEYSDDAKDPVIDFCGGLCGSVSLGNGYDNPFVGVGFNVAGEYQYGVDVTGWGGLCVVYAASGITPVLEIVTENEKSFTNYDNFKVTMPLSSTANILDVPWSKFKQEGWGYKASISDAVERIAAIKVNFSGRAGSVGTFNIMSIGRYGTCSSALYY